MKVKLKHISESNNKWDKMNQSERGNYVTKILDTQPNIGGQLAALIMKEGVPANLIDNVVKIVTIMLDSVKTSGCSLPPLTHDMFMKEQKNIEAACSLINSNEKGVLESMVNGCKEKKLMAYAVNEIQVCGINESHPKGFLITLVILSLVQLIDKHLT